MPEVPSRHEGLSIHDAAEKAGVHWQTIRNWINAGHLPVTRFGPGRRPIIRIHPDDLDALLKPREGEGPEELYEEPESE